MHFSEKQIIYETSFGGVTEVGEDSCQWASRQQQQQQQQQHLAKCTRGIVRVFLIPA
jgi:hypothetical protein